MNRNDFRLRSVLRAKRRELDAARERLAREVRAKEQDQRDEQDCLERLQQASQQLHERLAGRTTAAILRPAEGAMEVAHAGAVEASRRSDARDAAILEAREAVTTAHKNLRSLEILEEKWQEKRRVERAKYDQKILDEIATRSVGGSPW